MRQRPVVRELQPLITLGRREQAAKAKRRPLYALFSNPELFVVMAFCAIGLLVTINVLLRNPGVGTIFEELEHTP
jgi:hypothetical protein